MTLSRFVASCYLIARLNAVFTLSVLLNVPSAQAEASVEFIRGYLTAYFQFSAAGAEVKVVAVSDDRSVVLAADECITKTFQEKTRAELIREGIVTQVQWRVGNTCPKPATELAGDEGKPVITQTLPLHKLFSSPLADPRAARSSIRYEYYESPSGDFNAGAISAGDTFPLTTLTFSDAKELQVSIEGAIFSLFNLDEDSHDLINSDFILGFPISYRSGSWSVRLRPYHQSSHLGDELLLNNPETTRVNLSYEDIELLASYDFELLRLYGGGSAIVNSNPDLDPFRLQGGVELRLPEIFWEADLVLAADIQTRQEVSWRVDQSYILGFAFTPAIALSERELRVVAEYFDGSSPNGQFYEEQIRYWGLGIQLDL